MGNENDGEADKKERREKMKSGFEVVRHISQLPPTDLPI